MKVICMAETALNLAFACGRFGIRCRNVPSVGIMADTPAYTECDSTAHAGAAA